jgi:hypothetical protein
VRLTPSQIGMAHLCGHCLPMRSPPDIRERVRSGREFLRQITRQDFGYNPVQWHEYLWETDAGGYRWARRSRERWLRFAQAALADPAWQEAVRQLTEE